MGKPVKSTKARKPKVKRNEFGHTVAEQREWNRCALGQPHHLSRKLKAEWDAMIAHAKASVAARAAAQKPPQESPAQPSPLAALAARARGEAPNVEIPGPFRQEDLRPVATPDLLVARAWTHGLFKLTAGLSQELKSAMCVSENGNMPPEQREALEMIAVKMARICCGDSHHADHWDDIAGFARLGRRAIRVDTAKGG